MIKTHEFSGAKWGKFAVMGMVALAIVAGGSSYALTSQMPTKVPVQAMKLVPAQKVTNSEAVEMMQLQEAKSLDIVTMIKLEEGYAEGHSIEMIDLTKADNVVVSTEETGKVKAIRIDESEIKE